MTPRVSSRRGIELGLIPIEAPRIVTTVCCVARWNSGRSSAKAAEKPPEIITRISAPLAGPAAVAAVMVEGRRVLRDGRILAFDETAVLDRLALGPELLAAARPDIELAAAAAAHFTRL